ncbi:M28 family peptidase [Actinocorallia sp. API 0066]|uniref:M28 family peptidase n=1 Tax=Actinocorallia sp. API 0066 TaxID=2896846 RepID=UPI001E480CAB|nr:M28 family peptidase [Actinocorallia sp. API 0066]MCD0453671.1 M28 family peptidase [Actinocorallia sp. API 0066]
MLTAGAAVLALLAVPGGATARVADPAARAVAGVRASAVESHLAALARIASAHGDTRAAGTPGYAAARDYLVTQLRAAGYRPVVQEFDFPYFQEEGTAELSRLSPTPHTYLPSVAGADKLGDFATMTFSGSGDVSGPVRAVDAGAPAKGKASTSGCEAADFAGFPRGAVALLRRGTCTFAVKAANAQAAGAAAAVIFNDGGEGRTDTLSGTVGKPGEVAIPVLGASHAVGEELARAGTTVRVTTRTTSETRQTWNVIADTRRGDPRRVVMVGAHFDSVPEGPGINDNASGAAALLELAKYAYRVPVPNRLRFAWWGAEELGLLGSEHYVAALSARERAAVRLYLNHDMIASPNHVYGIYDGDDSDRTGEGPGPEGSARIEKAYEGYFKAIGVPTQGTDFTGRSDYGPFIARGIPAGGLFTGAEGDKTEAEALRFGGTAGKPYDPCYHRACDTLANLNRRALRVNLGAMAHAAFTFAYTPLLPTPEPPKATPTSTAP